MAGQSPWRIPALRSRCDLAESKDAHRHLEAECQVDVAPRDTARQNNEPPRSAGVKRTPPAQAALTAANSAAKNCFSNASAGIGRPKK